MMRAGPRNSITDVGGLRVGNAEDHRLKSGVSVVVCDQPAVAAVQVLGGAPGTRGDRPARSAQHGADRRCDRACPAVRLSGLTRPPACRRRLREMGRGFAVGPLRIPIVPAAILFDLINGGDKDWGQYPPYRELGYQAVQAASRNFATGTAGAGTGALTATFKGGLGTASTVLDNGITIGALVAVNALGSATIGETGTSGLLPSKKAQNSAASACRSLSRRMPATSESSSAPGRQETQNTTIAVIATDAVLTKAEAKRLAISAHDGFSRALWPSHTPLDGDLVFALATGTSGKTLAVQDFIDLGAAAASTMARAIARGVHDATPLNNDLLPAWLAGR